VIHLAVPPGVGDVYWVLTKLQAYKAAHPGQQVKLLVQACGDLDRAGQWRDMVDFIDHLAFWPFKPDRAALETGIGKTPQGWPILWPNAVVDKGRPLAEWLPDLALDLSFPVRTTHVPGGPRTVLYVSSDGINRAWMSHLPTGYWYDVVEALNKAVGRVTIIGAKWDRPFFERWIREAPRRLDVENLVQSTTLMQVADILKHARFFVGVISGMTILANHFRTPCAAIYPTAHLDAFPRTWVAADAPYWPIRTDRVPPALELAELVAAGARGLAA
jgi:hypothetical protein